MKNIAYDSVRLDEATIVEDSRCCLKVRSVITKVGVYNYPDGRAFKCPKQLLKAVRTARAAKLIINDHPDSMVIMSQTQMHGTVEKPFFDKDKIRAVLNFDKYVVPKTYIDSLRSKIIKKQPIDVSIGFYYQPDFTPGVWKGQPYDYVMKDIVIDHVAAGVLKGRCPSPSCGIGVDTAVKQTAHSTKIGLDPFGEYSSMQDCIDKNQEKQQNPAAFCAWLHHKVTGKWPAEASLNVSNYGGKKMSKKTDYGHAKSPEEVKAEFDQCVAERMAEGAQADPPITREQAEAICLAATAPQNEPTPYEELDQDELSEWQQCIKEQVADGKTAEEAAEACKAKGLVKGDQDAAFDNCVERLVEEGKTREEAEKECRAEHPIGEGDAEPEQTPLERCIVTRMEATEDTEEEAKAWCEAELAGEHEAADSMVEQSEKILRMREQRNIERQRRQRRNPL